MPEFVKVGSVADFPDKRGRTVVVAERRVAVFKHGGRFYALQDRCPHMSASLADGKVENGKVACFMHGWLFDLATGQGHPPAKSWACARSYEVKLDGDDVLIASD